MLTVMDQFGNDIRVCTLCLFFLWQIWCIDAPFKSFLPSVSIYACFFIRACVPILFSKIRSVSRCGAFERPFYVHVLPNVFIRISEAVCVCLYIHTTSWACLESAVWQGDESRKVGQSCSLQAWGRWMDRGRCLEVDICRGCGWGKEIRILRIEEGLSNYVRRGEAKEKDEREKKEKQAADLGIKTRGHYGNIK